MSSHLATASRSLSVVLLTAALFAAPSSAMTRITPAATGIGQNDDGMGSSISIHAGVAAVGMPLAKPIPTVNSGAVEILRQTSGVWARETFLQPADAEANLRFGTAVAVGDDIAVVTAHRAGGTTGDVYTFARSGSSWTQVDEFPVPLLAVSAYSIALSGQTLVVADGHVAEVYIRSGNGWTQQAVLGPAPREPDGIFPPPGEVFGGGVAIDGDLVAVPAINNDFASNTAEVLLYVFERSGDTWSQQARVDLGPSPYSTTVGLIALSGSTAMLVQSQSAQTLQSNVRILARSADVWTEQVIENGGARLSTASIALDGDRAMIGSPADTVLGQAGAGTAYLLTRSGDIWTREAHIYDSDNYAYSAGFGGSVALSGASALVGSPNAYAQDGNTGKVNAFALDGGTWNLVQTIDDGSARAYESVGQAVALSSDTLLAGAPGARGSSDAQYGAAYVFDRTGSSWTESARLVPTAATTQGFGSAVALDSDTAAIGAAYDESIGAVYVYTRDAGQWPLQQKLSAAGADAHYFGWSVALDGDLLAVGEPASINELGYNLPPGIVHIFERSGASWSEQSTIQPADSSAQDEFGFTLAKSGDTLLIGAPRAEVDINTDAGAVYAYVRSGADWTLQAKIAAPIPGKGTCFGVSVAIAGDTAIIGSGAEVSFTTPIAGAAYVYRRFGSDWIWQTTLEPPAALPRVASYGRSVALSADGSLALVSMPYTGQLESPAEGAVFTFQYDGTQWTDGPVWQGSPPTGPYFVADNFGISTSIFGTDVAFGAPGDGLTGAAYVTSLIGEIFADGFDSQP